MTNQAGVSQGSILGPNLHTICIADFLSHPNNTDAKDTAILSTSKKIYCLSQTGAEKWRTRLYDKKVQWLHEHCKNRLAVH